MSRQKDWKSKGSNQPPFDCKVNMLTTWRINWGKKSIINKSVYEPAHEIMALFVSNKLILQTRMRSHPVGLDVWFFGQTLCLFPYFMCAKSEGSGETARMRRLAWAFAGRLCDKYQNWLKYCYDSKVTVSHKHRKTCFKCLFILRSDLTLTGKSNFLKVKSKHLFYVCTSSDTFKDEKKKKMRN